MSAWSEFWRTVWVNATAYGPRFIQVVLVMGIHIGVAFLIRYFSFRVIRKALKWMSRRDGREHADGFGNTARTVSQALFWLVILFGLTGAMEYMGLPVLSLWFEHINRVLPNWIAAFFIVLLAWIGGNFLRDAVNSSARSAGMARPEWAGRYVRLAVLSVGLVLAVSQVGLNVAFLTYLILVLLGTSLLGASLAFGLGAAPFVRSILAGHYIQKQYRVGDWIEIGNKRGRILRMMPHAVILETETGTVTIPSHKFQEEVTTMPKVD